MIQEDQFSNEQKLLYDLMSEISEAAWCASWLIDNEYSIWNAILTKDYLYGPFEDIDAGWLDKCRCLSKELNGWIIWVDGDLFKEEKTGEYCGPAFISMDEWSNKFDAFMSKKAAA